MRVFISWSGDRSRAVAEALRTWLPRVIQSIRPWMSQEDISAGSRWLSEVSTVLDNSHVGILCVTPENQHNPWLLFEAGALSKSIDESRVCPLLFDMTAGQLSGPMTQFQSHALNSQGLLRVLSALNDGLGDAKLPERELAAILEVWWPHLEAQLKAIGAAPAPAEVRSTQEQLDELLSLAREHIRRENLRLEASREKDEKFSRMLTMMDESFATMNGMETAAKKMQGSVKDAFSTIIDKINSQEIPPGEAIRQMFEVSVSGSDAVPKIDMKALNEMRTQMAELEQAHRRHIDSILTPPASDETSQLQS